MSFTDAFFPSLNFPSCKVELRPPWKVGSAQECVIYRCSGEFCGPILFYFSGL